MFILCSFQNSDIKYWGKKWVRCFTYFQNYIWELDPLFWNHCVSENLDKSVISNHPALRSDSRLFPFLPAHVWGNRIFCSLLVTTRFAPLSTPFYVAQLLNPAHTPILWKHTVRVFYVHFTHSKPRTQNHSVYSLTASKHRNLFRSGLKF